MAKFKSSASFLLAMLVPIEVVYHFMIIPPALHSFPAARMTIISLASEALPDRNEIKVPVRIRLERPTFSIVRVPRYRIRTRNAASESLGEVESVRKRHRYHVGGNSEDENKEGKTSGWLAGWL